MPKISIYDKYGGFDFFHKIIYELYLELFDHIEISYHFVGVDIKRLSLMQAQFLCEAIGAPKMYQGGDLTHVHKHLKISEFEFETVVKRFEEIFKSNGLDDEEIRFITKFIRFHQPAIVTTKNTWIDRVAFYFYKRINKITKWIKDLMRRTRG